MSNESVKSFTVSRNHHLFLPLMDVRDVSRISNGKSSWCSRKPAGRLVGQPSRWYQSNSASWAAVAQPGKVTISSATQVTCLPAHLKLPVVSCEIRVFAGIRIWQLKTEWGRMCNASFKFQSFYIGQIMQQDRELGLEKQIELFQLTRNFRWQACTMLESFWPCEIQ